jgi:phosphate transport system substrate-binding protein
LNDAVASFIVDKNVDTFATALAQESKKVAPIMGRLQFSTETIEVVSPDLPPDAPPQYAEDVKDARKLNIIFHFRSGSTQLDDRALADFRRLVTLLQSPTYQGKNLLLFGFSDNSGRNRLNAVISKERAETVAKQLQKEGITPALVTGYGKALPIATNETREGREQNRRVEVWFR